MRVTIRQKDLEVTPALRQYIEMKLIKPVRRLLQNSTEKEFSVLDLEFSRTSRHHRKGKVYHAEANLSLGGKLLRAEVDDEGMRSACDLLGEELEREILGYKSRVRALERRGARRAKKDFHFDPAARMYRSGRIRDEGN